MIASLLTHSKLPLSLVSLLLLDHTEDIFKESILGQGQSQGDGNGQGSGAGAATPTLGTGPGTGLGTGAGTQSSYSRAQLSPCRVLLFIDQCIDFEPREHS